MRPFFLGFLERGGVSVVTSGVLVKVISLVLLAYLARVLDEKSFGNISYAWIIVNFSLILSSGGFSRTLLRYGALCADDDSLRSLLGSLFLKGLSLSLLVFVIIFAGSGMICSNRLAAIDYLRALSTLVVIDYLFQMLGSSLRIRQLNRRFALLNLTRSGLTALFTIALVQSVAGIGYVISLVLAPVVAYMFVSRDRFALPCHSRTATGPSDKSHWRFLLLTTLSAALSKSAFFVDGIVVGNLIEDAGALAEYRIASLLPISVLILPTMFFTSEYVHITGNCHKREYVVGYLKDYLKISAGVSFILIFVTQAWGDMIIVSVFGKKYSSVAALFQILTIGICGALMVRQPFGNLNSACGRPGLNLLSGMATFVVSIFLLLLLIPEWGLLGAAIATALSLWISGLLAMALYLSLVFPKTS